MNGHGMTIPEVGFRASRFPVELPLRYRPLGELGWVEGRTINVSRSGVLFAVDELLPEETPIELAFDLPPEMGGGPGEGVTCRGQVVRTILPPSTDDPPAVAVSIAGFRSYGN
ncbi:MAG: PilZ domain-containing protein [Terriglobia bacterium]